MVYSSYSYLQAAGSETRGQLKEFFSCNHAHPVLKETQTTSVPFRNTRKPTNTKNRINSIIDLL